MPDWCLGVADFPKTTQEQFDAWIPPTDRATRERRPRGPTTAAVWHDQADREIRGFALVYGQEHSAERLQARRELEALHEADPNKWPVEEIFSIYEELKWDWVD